ncbi:MAG: hypothetical protein Q4F00_10490 [bacterium]|nr:hypothetical protein [bacterium]
MPSMPLQSVSSLVDAARISLPKALVSDTSYQRLQALASLLPQAILVGLECRLRTEDEPVDLWICPALEPDALQQSVPWLRRQAWPEFAPLAGRLEKKSPPWPCQFGAWTTEFDLKNWDTQSNCPPIPSSFVTFSTASPPLNIRETLAALWQGERAAAMPSEIEQQLRTILEHCPKGELAGLGFLYPRIMQPARLMLRVSQLSDLRALLGDKLPIAQKLLDSITFQVAIGTPFDYRQEPRQSLEAYLPGPEAWQELAKRLVAQGYSTAAKTEAMLDLALHPRSHGKVMVTLNHVKLALHADGYREVKAYPSIFPISSMSFS